MAKVMVFIDGGWLPGALGRLADAAGGREPVIDWGRLPRVLAEAVRARLGLGEVDVVRALAFGPAPGADGAGGDGLLARLAEEHHYEVEACPTPGAAQVALAAALLGYAALPHAYDVAVVLAGDAALAAALRRARGAGKRVALASVRGACDRELAAPREAAALVDCGALWLDDLLARLGPRPGGGEEPEAPAPPRRLRETWLGVHRRGVRPQGGARPVGRERPVGHERPVGGERRARWRGAPGAEDAVGGFVSGPVVKLVPEKQIGFLRTAAGGDYYFNFAYLDPSLPAEELVEGMEVEGEVYRLPTDRAGAVRGVRRRGGAAAAEAPELTEG